MTSTRMPPSSVEAEEALLGAVLLAGHLPVEVAANVEEADFWRPAHRTVWRAVNALADAGDPVNPIAVLGRLQATGELEGVGGAPFVHTLFAAAGTAAETGYYAHIVAEAATRRQLIDTGARIVQLGYETSQGTQQVLAEAERLVRRLNDRQPGGASDLFRLWTPAELLADDQPLHWRIRGMLVHPTYGPVGGEQKTLKSYVLAFIAIGLAAGVPIFDHFKVDKSAPVVVYVGEGGRLPYTRRLKRIAAAMNVKLADLPLATSFDVAPIGSERFTESLERDLKREPGLIAVDPLYAFHPATTSASNLYERGSMLASLSGRCVDAGASLLVPDHWNKTGTGKGLDRISQAGVQQWADTWLLLSHREDPDVENGSFQLLLEIGSRQWGGSSWNLDLLLGRFDVDLGEYDGAISWDLARATTQDRGEAKLTPTARKVLRALREAPMPLSIKDVCQQVTAQRETVSKALNAMLADGFVDCVGERAGKRWMSVSKEV